MFTGPASCIAQIVAGPAAAGAGFAGLVLACELARHQWEPLAVAARAEASLLWWPPNWRKLPSLECRKRAKRPGGA